MRRSWFVGLLLVAAGCSPFLPTGERYRPAPPDPPISESNPVGVTEFTSQIDTVTAEQMPHSWRPECPVSPEDLRLISVTHWGFDGAPHQGALVVHADHADGIVSVMRRLYDDGFPIERMELVDVYRGDDDESMAMNNTSAFNCREVSRRPGVWSQHAYGLAIDINPVQNPYILSNGTVLPPEALTDRATPVTGLIAADSVVVEAFAGIGWGWGGAWTSGVLDYQHFSATGK